MNFLKTKNPLKATLLFGVFSILRSGISLLLLPIFLNYLSPEDYGIISLVVIYSSIVVIIGSLGLKSALFTFYFDFDNADELKRYLSNLFSLHILTFSLIAVIHILFGENIYGFLFSSNKVSFNDFGLIALLSVLFEALNSLYFVFLKNEVNLKAYFRYTISTIVLTVFFQVLFITYYHLGVLGFLYGMLIPNIIVFLCISFSNNYLYTIKFKKKLLYPSLNFSLRLMPFLLFFAFENRIDKYLVELNLGLESVGLYSLLIKVFGLLTIALNAFDDGIRPFFYRNLKESKSLVNKYFNLYFGFGILILTVINSIGYNLEYILKNKDYLVIQEYFLIGSIIFIMIIPVRFYGLVLVFYKESKKLSYLAFIKVTIITVLMILLIPKFELYGALYALFFSYLVNIIMFSYILYQKINVIPNWKSLIYLSIFMIGSYLTFQQMESGQKLLYSGVYIAVLMGAFIWLYKKEGYAIIKQKI